MSICHGETKAENLHFYQTPAPVNLLAGRFLVSRSGAALKCQVRSPSVCPPEKKRKPPDAPNQPPSSCHLWFPPKQDFFFYFNYPSDLNEVVFWWAGRGGLSNNTTKQELLWTVAPLCTLSCVRQVCNRNEQ